MSWVFGVMGQTKEYVCMFDQSKLVSYIQWNSFNGERSAALFIVVSTHIDLTSLTKLSVEEICLKFQLGTLSSFSLGLSSLMSVKLQVCVQMQHIVLVRLPWWPQCLSCDHKSADR